MNDVNFQKLINRLVQNEANAERIQEALTKEQLKQFANALKENTSVISLILCIHLGDKGAKYIAEALMANNSLKSLCIRGYNKIYDGGAQYIAEMLQHNNTLTSLTVNNSHIGDKGAKALANAFRLNSSLEYLDLSANHIGSEGALYLVKTTLENENKLVVLGLCNNRIWKKKVKAILNTVADAMQRKRALFVNLASNPIDVDEDLLKLQKTINNFFIELTKSDPSIASINHNVLLNYSSPSLLYYHYNELISLADCTETRSELIKRVVGAAATFPFVSPLAIPVYIVYGSSKFGSMLKYKEMKHESLNPTRLINLNIHQDQSLERDLISFDEEVTIQMDDQIEMTPKQGM